MAPLQPFRLGLIGNGTLDLLAPILVASAARHGLALECIQADYGQTTQEALDPDSRINLRPAGRGAAGDRPSRPAAALRGRRPAGGAGRHRRRRWPTLDAIREGIRSTCRRSLHRADAGAAAGERCSAASTVWCPARRAGDRRPQPRHRRQHRRHRRPAARRGQPGRDGGARHMALAGAVEPGQAAVRRLLPAALRRPRGAADRRRCAAAAANA